MKITIALLFFLILTNQSSFLAQTNTKNIPENRIELRAGAEVKRFVPILGIGKNYNLTNLVSVSPELLIFGTAILGGTGRLNFSITREIKISAHAGLGIAFVGLPISTAGIFGLNFQYRLNENLNIFIEPRIIIFSKDLISIGKGFWGIDDVNTKTPVVVTVGIGF